MNYFNIPALSKASLALSMALEAGVSKLLVGTSSSHPCSFFHPDLIQCRNGCQRAEV